MNIEMDSTADISTDDRATDTEMLEALYRAYDSWTKQYQFACSEGCAPCCTQSVTMTTLEGERIIDYLRQNGQLGKFAALLAACRPSMRPVQTTNRFAACCLAREEPAQDNAEWDFTPCIFLENKLCTIYPMRPFGCRSFSSTLDCSVHGTAEVPPVLITVNAVVLQIIEHLNIRGGYWGNMVDVLRYLLSGQEGEAESHLLAAQPNPGFLIPQEEMPDVAAFFARINGPNIKGDTLVGLLKESTGNSE
jgi:Fe-S-cluster containining protein